MLLERAQAVTPDSVEAFFEELASRGHEPLLRKATGSARFAEASSVVAECARIADSTPSCRAIGSRKRAK